MITLRDVRLYTHRFPLRRPFRFGIVELSELEHLVVAANFVINGETVAGFAGENLVPRWFVKDPSLAIEDEIASIRRAVRVVAGAALSQPAVSTPFDFWWRLHRFVRDRSLVVPRLLAQLAESLIERAALDAWSRFHRATFAELLHADRLGIALERVHDCLRGSAAASDLFGAPQTSLVVRHTVGLADDLGDLAHRLREAGIRRLKIKLAGDAQSDASRIGDVVRMCESSGWSIDLITLDGNENYHDLSEFERLASLLKTETNLRVAARLIAWIEQPFHRRIALSDDVGAILAQAHCAPTIIDESDSAPADLPRALELGYAGATHKSCKGVFNSILHRALLAKHAALTGKEAIFSGEDLTIVAPWSQASDLTVAATVGITDIERNGHHFADGLSGFGTEVSEQALRDSPRLYRRRHDGVVDLRIVDGRVEVPSQTPGPPSLNQFAEVTE
jgi:hypothetical protein